MTAQDSRTPGRAAFAFIFVTVMLDMLALGVMAPVLPKLIITFKDGDIASAASVTGLFGFTWAAMQFVFSPVLGSLSDRYGRRLVILLSNFGLGLDYVLMALAPSLEWLFIGRLISGITAASFSTAGAYISDVTPVEKRAARFGMLGAAFGLGFIVGPAVGGVLGDISLRLPFWAAAVLSLLNAAYGFFVLPESLPPERRSAFQWRRANPLGSLKLLRSHGELTGLAAATFLYYLAHESLSSIFVLYTDYRYAWSERTVGLALAAVGVTSTIVSGALMGPAVARLGERRAMLTGLAFGALSFLCYGLAPTGLLFLIGIPLGGLMGLAGPSIQALMTRRVNPSEQGQLQGAMSSLRGITGMIGPVLFTQILAAALRGDSLPHLPGAPYLLAGTLMVGALFLSWRVTRLGAREAVTSDQVAR
ncbi:TCR/Tet family MFS transporter [Hyalangium sp.]|uniref:TCR/Tet family MFS transporter n=1 Tax=Hyalangium sp. TaxID=2028555 RepID=UPI002D31E39D|nr:TCR/Tet family MFS transporter [Hyalangium sp.]HYH97770.1 TCR/Tet family MFS transporter [Hyalangium sp.]